MAPAVEPYLLAADQAVAEAEDVQDAKPSQPRCFVMSVGSASHWHASSAGDVWTEKSS
jgi:hypothetical protein